MKKLIWIGGIAGLLVAGAQAHGERSGDARAAQDMAAPLAARSDWTRPLAAPGAVPAPTSPNAAPDVPATVPELDVVDAHWLALTMWGEARGQGEEAMRAVGHVIDNRRRTGAHGSYVTDTVSEAWQFSCWNEGDPNRQAMLDVLSLPEGRERRMWVSARRMADEILAGQSADPTGGALFYHSTAVSPVWSRGLVPVRRIGSHLFFRSARRA